MLWLIGMMGSGKSTVGPRVADRLGLPFVDLDDRVVETAGIPIGEIFADGGEAQFREIESAVLAEVAAGAPAVVATGGGVVLEDRNVAWMRASGTVVWLSAEPSTMAERIGADLERPLLDTGDPAGRLAEILELRHRQYTTAAHWQVDTEGRGPDDVAEEVIRRWHGS